MNKKWFLLLLIVAFAIYWMVWPVENCLSQTSPTAGSSGDNGGCGLGPIQWNLAGQLPMQ